MKKLIILFSFISLISACGGGKTPEAGTGTNPYSTGETASGTPEYDPNRGLGKWTAENVNVGATLDPTMAAAGEKIQAVKCVSCHRGKISWSGLERSDTTQKGGVDHEFYHQS